MWGGGWGSGGSDERGGGGGGGGVNEKTNNLFNFSKPRGLNFCGKEGRKPLSPF